MDPACQVAVNGSSGLLDAELLLAESRSVVPEYGDVRS
jgi:hypothetical protein